MSVEIRARAGRFARAVDVVAWAFCSSRCGVEWRGLARVRAAYMSVWERLADTASVAMRAVLLIQCIRGIALGIVLKAL